MTKLVRNIGYTAGVSILAGGIIGSGIFMKPATMALQLGSPVLMLLVWLLAGIVVLFGALCNAEAGAMFPETGGQYVLFQKMYGNKFAFIYGWASVAVFNTAGIASIAFICAEYLLNALGVRAELNLFEFSLSRVFLLKTTASILLLLFTILNIRSVKQSEGVQILLTALKLLAIAVLIFGLLSSDRGSVDHIMENSNELPMGFAFVTAFFASFAGAFWAFDGWNGIVFIAGEIKQPQRNLPRILITGIAISTLVYLFTAFSLSYIVPLSAMNSETVIAFDAGLLVWGSGAASIIALMIAISTAGSLNSNVLSTARITYAFGDENKKLSFLAGIHPSFFTPNRALAANLVLAILYVISGSFDSLTDMLIFVSWFFYGMGALGLFILRKKYPKHERPFKTPLYPILPAVFVTFTAIFVMNTFFYDLQNYIRGITPGVNSLIGITITLLGLPLYYWANRKM
jgi:APA family basic amino acid/polyamine antiporter